MGLGPTILSLYHQLKLLGALEGIDSVIELGSQGVWCPDRRLLVGLFKAFGRPVPPENQLRRYINNTGTGEAPHKRIADDPGREVRMAMTRLRTSAPAGTA